MLLLGGREVVREVGEAEALEGLSRCAADFWVIHEALKLKRLVSMVVVACSAHAERP